MASQKSGTPKKRIAAKSAGKAEPSVPIAAGGALASPEPIAQPAERTGFAIVGIGASAGGLAAFESFFSGMPTDADPGMAFVLVQHLAPDHKSILTELIRRYTRMQVSEVEDGVVVQPNCAYIIPPGRDMAFLNGALHLFEPTAPRGQRLPIDFFFRSLAQDQRELAIGIVLSGTGSDGSLGVRAIKGEGGMVMVQNPESTEYDGMPRSAIATRLVDYELRPEEMAPQLMAYVARSCGKPQRLATNPSPKVESALKKIFILLRSITGHDFSRYKPNTIHRRIERRLAVHQIETLESYASFLQHTPEEVEALFHDLLIGVTNFFRDPEAFKALEEQIIPKLFAGKSAEAGLRVWSPGCSTGEEAYSIAILLQERMEALKQTFKVQVFATDIDGQAIATARAGLYPASIALDLSAERLARFFTTEAGGGGYRIHKVIRDMMIFSEQDLIKDPPFSRLDLISCRNLLIYMDGDLQKKLIPLFHYALNPGGYLFQGTSETVGEFGDLFAAVDRKAKLYKSKEEMSGTHRAALGRILPNLTAGVTLAPMAGKRPLTVKQPLREITEQALLEQIAPAGALVNARGDILYLHGHTSLYLELPAGVSAVNNILKMARKGWRHELTTALHKAVGTQEIVRCQGLQVQTNGHSSPFNLSIRPVNSNAGEQPETTLYLVVFEESLGKESASQERSHLDGDPASDAEQSLSVLKRELRAKEEYLKASNEELETSNEELKSSNEEMQSVNEELQSTNEELETSKEELQSVNEELATVNAELQTKVVDLSRANNDMNNLLAGTGIGTVFVDQQLRILRFTPAANRITNMIQGDVGRPVGHIASNLMNYDCLVEDAQTVLDTLIPKEVEVQTRDEKWYTLRIQLYRTLDNVIEGVVITFVDNTEMKRAEAALRESESLFRQMAATLPQLVWTCNADGLHDYISPQWVEFTGVPEAQQLGFRWLEQVHPEDRGPLVTAWNRAVATGEPFELGFRLRHYTGEYHDFETHASAFRDAAGRIVKWFGLNTDITGRAPQDQGGTGWKQQRRERSTVNHEQL